ncbi:hypothetical protein ACOYW6_07440 [Parablastomonas sp. CN1-191]|uniref:hypothetical protein n=1 Tax=Parablastomonas sp. CN1-191 TaxID=3400908 RepID=UPI003BF7B533
MSELVVTHADVRPRTPITYWVVAVVGALWNALGATDYVMTRLHDQAWLARAGDPAAILAWIASMPLWVQIGWGFGVWGSVAGSLLMLVRSRQATGAFLVSLVGAVVSIGYQVTHAMPAAVARTADMMMPLVIVAIVFALWRYCRHAGKRGWLR